MGIYVLDILVVRNLEGLIILLKIIKNIGLNIKMLYLNMYDMIK